MKPLIKKHSFTLFLLFLLFLSFSACKKEASSNFEHGDAVGMSSQAAVDVPASETKMPISSTDNQGLAQEAFDKSYGESTSNSKPKNDQSSSNNTQEKPIDKASKIIKDGNVTIEVEKIQEAKVAVDKIVKLHNAYYEVDAFNSTEYQSQYDIKIRIKNDKFDLLANQVIAIDGIVKHKDINARDVTEEYIDTESRLSSSKAYLKRYQELLNRANSIKDIIELESKIQEIQSNIDSYAGRLKYLNDRVDYSTLNITLVQNHEHYKEVHKDHFGKKILNAFKVGIDIVFGVLLFTISIWPVLILLGLLWYFRKRIFKKTP